ncbi:hypothetical protein [Enterococcus crotali]|uniref:hypothetical protein n=1 Tax=Enterococcus crotali TaxID=1453587 RepID=UPI000471592A|nr:hypothetical protein [Enterococcus crotali]OTP48031.1 hypothetical protein A5881_003153 [Enterococcus termitis]
MTLKKILVSLIAGSILCFFTACTPETKTEVKESKTSTSSTAEKMTSHSPKELAEIFEKTIPDTDNHFENNEEGLEAFVRYVEEFPPLVELSMIEKIRENGPLYFTEDQMIRLNKAFEETTAL